MEYLVICIISYLLGSFSTAYIIGRLKGIDIRESGSHNAGASNVKVHFGWGWAIVCGLIDFGKAALAIFICKNLYPDNVLIPYIAGGMSIVGHMYPFYMQFKGGKGFACYIGMLLAINWKLGLVMMAICAAVTYVTDYIVAGTFAVMILVPAYYIYKGSSLGVICVLIAISALIIYKHRVNIKRILNHEEIGLRASKNYKQEK